MHEIVGPFTSKQFTLLLNFGENTTVGMKSCSVPIRSRGGCDWFTLRLASQSSLIEAILCNHFEEPSEEEDTSGEEELRDLCPALTNNPYSRA